MRRFLLILGALLFGTGAFSQSPSDLSEAINFFGSYWNSQCFIYYSMYGEASKVILPTEPNPDNSSIVKMYWQNDSLDEWCDGFLLSANLMSFPVINGTYKIKEDYQTSDFDKLIMMIGFEDIDVFKKNYPISDIKYSSDRSVLLEYFGTEDNSIMYRIMKDPKNGKYFQIERITSPVFLYLNAE